METAVEIIPPYRDEATGKFVAGSGTSPNPGGVAKVKREVIQLAREASPAAMRRLIQIVEDDDAPVGAHLAAAAQILDRAFGKPKQAVEVEQTGRTLEELLRAVHEAKAAQDADKSGE